MSTDAIKHIFNFNRVNLLVIDVGSIIEARWGQPRSAISEPITLHFTTDGCEEGDIATLNIDQYDHEDNIERIETITHTLDNSNGEHEVTWVPIESDLPTQGEMSNCQTASTVNDNTGEVAPYTYEFRVTVNEGDPKSSKSLILTKTIIIKALIENGDVPEDETEITLTSPEGEEHSACLADGEVRFDDIAIGPIDFFVSDGEVI